MTEANGERWLSGYVLSEAIRRLMASRKPIPCCDLVFGVGYPGPYSIAEKALSRAGWNYFVLHDTWFPPGEHPK